MLEFSVFTVFVKDVLEKHNKSSLLDVMTTDYWICIILQDHQYDMSMFACHLSDRESDLPLMASIFHGMIYRKKGC